MKTLRDHYRDVINRGWTKQEYPAWRGSVVRRINKMYKTRHRNLSDAEIENYLNKAQFYRP